MGILAVISLLLSYTAFAESQSSASLNQKPYVDIMLVLATDVSASIGVSASDVDEYALQKQGILRALRDDNLGRVLDQCNSQGVGLAFVEWSGSEKYTQVQTVLGWTRLTSRRDLQDFANQIENTTRSFSGATDVYSALLHSFLLFESAPFQSAKKIIHISSDGHNNTAQRFSIQGVVPPKASYSTQVDDLRDYLVSQQITINALVIDDIVKLENSPLKLYYEKNVQGGVGSYTALVHDFKDYGDILAANLARDLNNCLF